MNRPCQDMALLLIASARLIEPALTAPGFRLWLVETLGVTLVAIVGGLLILPLGIILYTIRQRRLMLYAYLEIFFGIFYGIYTIGDKDQWQAISEVKSISIATWTALASSVYIVVRGLDNRGKAKAEMNEQKNLSIPENTNSQKN
jgi:hypothetical protein